MDSPLIEEVDPEELDEQSRARLESSDDGLSDSSDGIDADSPARPARVARESTESALRAAGFITCPAGCGAWLEPRAEWLTGVPELDRTAPRGAVTSAPDGGALSHAQVMSESSLARK